MNLTIIFISVLLNSAAQILIRKGMLAVGQVSANNLLESLVPMITNYWLWGAIVCYGVSFFTWMIALSKFEVSYAYPFLSVGYIVTAVFGFVFLSENISVIRCLGLLTICLGIIYTI